MDYNKLYSFVTNKFRTDVILIIKDEKKEIIANFHSIILCASSLYFETLLTKFNEKNLTEISINVYNADVVYDIILSFYNKPIDTSKLNNWKYQLKLIRCLDYFNLKIDYDMIRKMIVPNDHYQSLVNVIDIIGYNDITITCLTKNLPINFDLINFKNETLIKMVEKSKYFCVCSANENTISIDYLIDDEPNRQIITSNTIKVSYSMDGTKLVSMSLNGSIKIWNSFNCELIYEFPIKYKFFALCVNKLFLVKEGKKIELYDIINFNLIHEINTSSGYIYKITCSPDGTKFAIITNDNSYFMNSSLTIWNTINYQLIYKFDYDTVDYITDICFSLNSKKFAFSTFDYIKILNLENYFTDDIITEKCFTPDFNIQLTEKCFALDDKNNNIIVILKTNKEAVITNICFSPESKYIVAGFRDTTIKIWDSVSALLLHTINTNDTECKNLCYTPDNSDLAYISLNTLKTLEPINYQAALSIDNRSCFCFSQFIYNEKNNWIQSYIDKNN